jgi:hypothetical protein
MGENYEGQITLFSPEGKLLQIGTQFFPPIFFMATKNLGQPITEISYKFHEQAQISSLPHPTGGRPQIRHTKYVVKRNF